MNRPPAYVLVVGAVLVALLVFLAVQALTTPSRFDVDVARTELFGPLVALAAAWWAWRQLRNRVAATRIGGGREVVVRIEGHAAAKDGGISRDVAEHEAAHKLLIESQGGRVTAVRAFPNGSGYVRGTLPRRAGVVGEVAVSVAGGLAEGTFAYSTADLRNVEAALARVPGPERARAKRDGYALARSRLFWNSGKVNSDARKIIASGGKLR